MQPQREGLTSVEQAQFAASTERVRQFRRRAGVPDGVTLEEAVARHMIGADELERARWGPLAPPLTESTSADSARDADIP